jgi:hypothetical protein
MSLQVVSSQAKCKIKHAKKSFSQSQAGVDRKSASMLLVPATQPASSPFQVAIQANLFRPRNAPLTTGFFFGKSIRAAVGIRQWLAPLDGRHSETLWSSFH